MQNPNRRVQRLIIDPINLIGILTGKLKLSGLPDDAEVLFVYADPERNCVGAMVKSSTFDEIESGAVPPMLMATLRLAAAKVEGYQSGSDLREIRPIAATIPEVNNIHVEL